MTARWRWRSGRPSGCARSGQVWILRWPWQGTHGRATGQRRRRSAKRWALRLKGPASGPQGGGQPGRHLDVPAFGLGHSSAIALPGTYAPGRANVMRRGGLIVVLSWSVRDKDVDEMFVPDPGLVPHGIDELASGEAVPATLPARQRRCASAPPFRRRDLPRVCPRRCSTAQRLVPGPGGRTGH